MQTKVTMLFGLFCFLFTFEQSQAQIQSFVISAEQNKFEADKTHPEFFDLHQNVVYYQIQWDKNSKSELNYILELRKQHKDIEKILPIQWKTILLPADSLTQDSILLDNSVLGSGNFELWLCIKDSSGNYLSTFREPIQLLREVNNQKDISFRSDVNQNTSDILDITKTFVAAYQKEQLQRNIAALAPIASSTERIFISQVENENKLEILRRFFYNFWQSRNSVSPESEWRKYADKLNYVSKQFGTSTLKGFESDRGRIYLIYGEPDERIRIPNEKDALPHEIWSYANTNNRSNVRFLFYQPGMVSNQMFLLHSTLSNEIINPQWKTYLFTGPTDNQLTHRAFEYFK